MITNHSAGSFPPQGYGICEKTGETFPFTSRPNASKLISTLKKIESKGFSLKLCYEACYLGFALYRELEAAGIHSDVVARNMIPSKPGDRVKTDRKDSEKLALKLKSGKKFNLNDYRKQLSQVNKLGGISSILNYSLYLIQ